MPHNSADAATTFDPDRVLHRVGEFTLRALPHGSYLVELPDGTGVRVDEALWVLAAFATPRTPREVAEEAAGRAASVSDWIRAMDAIQTLAQLGVLRGPGEAAPRRVESGFAAESQHIQMLDDVTRTRAFIDAITAVVGPDDVVLDIGTGTGVLAMAAARAGARHTYAVEVSAMADVAEAGFAANGFADRITLLRGHSTSLTLPEPATVVVSEVIGDDLFDESILPTLADAARRLAAPDARFIPCSLQPVLQPLHLPDQVLDKMRYGSGRAEQWER